MNNLKLTNILLTILIALISWDTFIKTPEVVEPASITITIPEQTGSSGVKYVEPKVITVKVPRDDGSNIEVDSYWKAKYEEAITQKQKDSLYNEAIKINKYQDTLLSDDRVTIKGEATTRGSLLDFKVDYKLNEQYFTYTPEVVVENPRLTLELGTELGVPTIPNESFALKANLGLINKKGWGASISYDTDGRVWGGIKKTFKIIK